MTISKKHLGLQNRDRQAYDRHKMTYDKRCLLFLLEAKQKQIAHHVRHDVMQSRRRSRLIQKQHDFWQEVLLFSRILVKGEADKTWYWTACCQLSIAQGAGLVTLAPMLMVSHAVPLYCLALCSANMIWHTCGITFSVKSAGLSSRSNWSGFLVVGFALDGHSTTLCRELQRPVLTCIVPHGARPPLALNHLALLLWIRLCLLHQIPADLVAYTLIKGSSPVAQHDTAA